MAIDVVSGSGVELTLDDRERIPDKGWTASVLVGTPGVRTRAEKNAVWKDGAWRAFAVISGDPGTLKSMWRLVLNGVPTIVNGQDVQVMPGLSTLADQQEADREDAPPSDREWIEKALANAREVLVKASGSSELSVSVDGFSASFETRADLMAFIADLERRLLANPRGTTEFVPC